MLFKNFTDDNFGLIDNASFKLTKASLKLFNVNCIIPFSKNKFSLPISIIKPFSIIFKDPRSIYIINVIIKNINIMIKMYNLIFSEFF